MSSTLKGKTVLITGASSGIGLACAKAFAMAGAKLILFARRKEKLAELAAILMKDYGAFTHIASVDVSDRKIVDTTIDNLPRDFADIDILVNNAGLAAGLAHVSDADMGDWERMIDTNVKGLLYVTKRVLSSMAAGKGQKHIINIGSISGYEVYPGGAVYCATKFAVRALTEGLRKECFDKNIKVSTIDPGMVNTEFSLVRFEGDSTKADSVYDGMTPLSAEDVADAVLYCASAPEHVNIASLMILPSDQASVAFVNKQKL